jgi:hypothetical protein
MGQSTKSPPSALAGGDQPQRPRCPKCQMRMITVTASPDIQNIECLRCGHSEPRGAVI